MAKQSEDKPVKRDPLILSVSEFADLPEEKQLKFTKRNGTVIEDAALEGHIASLNPE